jgi:peroxiredoxin
MASGEILQPSFKKEGSMQSSYMKISRIVLAFVFFAVAFMIPISFLDLSWAAAVTLEEPMPDFTLPVYQGGEIKLSDLRGKNMMIIFPRGYAAPGAWCTICDYKYAELVEIEKTVSLRKQYNLEILFILPYDRDTVKAWLDALPGQLEKIRLTKNPPEPTKLDEKAKANMERYRKLFPKDLTLTKEEIPVPFPILIDGDRKVSKGLDLFRTEWGSKVDQNVPTTFILDRKGIVRYKYFSQSTADRPSYEYLMGIIDWITSGK